MREHHVHLGTFTRSVLVDVARRSGDLDRARLVVRESSVASSPAQFQSLEEGDLDVVFTSPDNVLAYRFLSKNPLGRILPVEVLCAIDRGLGLSLVVGPSIESIDQVRDHIVAVDVPQSGFAFVAYELLVRTGLHPVDYTVASLGSTPNRATALIEGQCSATVLNAGNELRAVGAGCRIVGNATDLGPYLGTVLASHTSDDAAINEARRRLVDVLLETSQQIATGALEPLVLESSMELLGLSDEQAQAHYACLRHPATGLVPDGVVDEASIATLLGLRRRFAPTPELDVVADSLSDFINSRALA